MRKCSPFILEILMMSFNYLNSCSYILLLKISEGLFLAKCIPLSSRIYFLSSALQTKNSGWIYDHVAHDYAWFTTERLIDSLDTNYTVRRQASCTIVSLFSCTESRISCTNCSIYLQIAVWHYVTGLTPIIA